MINQQINKFINIINGVESVSIICHIKPDADAIGSMVAMRVLLDKLGLKNIRMVCLDDMSDNLESIFKCSDEIYNLDLNSELYIFVDCSSLNVTGFPEENFIGAKTISIDHHSTHDSFADLNIVYTGLSSTAEIIFHLFKKLDFKIDNKVARALMAGILFDTGGLKHSNTSANTLRAISALSKYESNIDEINYYLFKKCSSRDLKMYGKIFRKAKINRNGVLSCILDKEDIIDFDCCELEIKKAIDYLNQIQGKKIALLGIKEIDNSIKISMRSESEEFDVAKIAHLFNGGGHIKAAGFKVNS